MSIFDVGFADGYHHGYEKGFDSGLQANYNPPSDGASASSGNGFRSSWEARLGDEVRRGRTWTFGSACRRSKREYQAMRLCHPEERKESAVDS